MRKILLLIMALIISISTTGAYAATENTFFLCMRAGSTNAYISDDGENVEYGEMESSNGSLVKAIVTDGSTYLPFRYVVEMAGWKEGAVKSSGSGTPKTFAYEANANGSKLKFRTNSKLYEQEIDKEFTYQVEGEEEERVFCIKNIEGSLYVPLRYMADILDAKTGWDSKTGNIYFASSRKVMNNFVDSNYTMKFSKLSALDYKTYDNNLMYSSIYMKSDGTTISNIKEDLKTSSGSYSCVSRMRKNIYFINDSDYKVYTKREDSAEISSVKFYNTKNSLQDITVDVILNDGKRLWGIAAEPGEALGKVFCADFDGMNFRYIDESSWGYNLLCREYDEKKYIFYVQDDNQTIVRINTETMEIQPIYVYDEADGDGINNIGILTIDKNVLIYKDLDSGTLVCVPFEQNIYTDTYISVNSDTFRYIDKCSGKQIGEVSSLNYDDENGILYFTAARDGGSGLYYYDVNNNNTGSLKTSTTGKTRVTIIKTDYDTYKVYNSSEGKNEFIVVSCKNDNVVIDGNVVLKR